MEAVISVEHVSKYYRLGSFGSGTLKRDLLDWWKGVKGEPVRDDQSRDHLWALQDVSLEIPEGEVLGLVGRNGAGKSTLLKIMSRISLPTSGRVRGRGRVASLLEVGTGFHEELTGRENIFLNGNILGMKKREITARFDEIVAFSGVERFIDTPIKRYSSGMYVRLAFAVAAHLDPAILLVDEVLAVGDAEFQRKCLGKMKEASSQQGKTVIFVSHNMQAINNLCSRAVWLEKGKVVSSGEPQRVTSNYLAAFQRKIWKQEWANPGSAPGNEWIRMASVELLPQLEHPSDPVTIRTPLKVNFHFHNLLREANLAVGVHLFTLGGECIFDVSHSPALYRKGLLEGSCEIPGNFLNDGAYYISIIVVKDTSQPLFYCEECLFFEVEDYRENTAWFGKWMGYVRPRFPVTLNQLETER